MPSNAPLNVLCLNYLIGAIKHKARIIHLCVIFLCTLVSEFNPGCNLK